MTNDPAKKIVRIGLKARIKGAIYLSSHSVYLLGMEQQAITRSVQVRSELNKPLKLKPIQFDLAGKVRYRIDEIEKGKKFRIRFSVVPGPPQSYRGMLRIKTNYPEKQEIFLRIRGKIQKKR